MALSKHVTLGNGVATNYHRVVSVTCVTNVGNLIEVASYTSRAKREDEMEALVSGTEHDVFVATTVISAPYDPAMTLASAYEYVKGLPELEGAKDVEDATV